MFELIVLAVIGGIILIVALILKLFIQLFE